MAIVLLLLSKFYYLNSLQRHLLLVGRENDIKKSVRKRVDELQRLVAQCLVRVELKLHLLPVLVREIPVNDASALSRGVTSMELKEPWIPSMARFACSMALENACPAFAS